MNDDLIIGPHGVLAALEKTPEAVDALWISDSRHDQRVHGIMAAAQAARIKVRRVPRARLDKMAGETPHQGVIARCRAQPLRDERELADFMASLPGRPLLLVLDGVQDPHNLGACLRTADATGAQAVIIPRGQSVSITAIVRRTACGAAETVPVFQVSNLSRALDNMKAAGIWLVGSDQNAPASLYDIDLTVPLALVLGGEGKGLRRLTRERCDWLARIPMQGSVASLNVSVAAAVCLYEALRQRQNAS